MKSPRRQASSARGLYMSFFNPFRKNAQARDAEGEPVERQERHDPQERLEPSAAGLLGESDRTSAPPPWGEPPKAMPDEAAKTPETVRLDAISSAAPAGSVPPAFEEVKPARETYDPYGIAAQAQAKAKAEAAREAERPASPAVDILPPTSAAESSPAPAEAAAAPELPKAAVEAAPVRASEAKESASAAAAPNVQSRPAVLGRKAASPAEAVEEPETVISEPKAAPKKSAEKTKVPLYRELTEEEIIARRRTKHRLVGAAALLLAVVVAAPFVLDNETAFETASIDTTIPSVTENTAELEVPPVPADSAQEAMDAEEAEEAAAAMAGAAEAKGAAAGKAEASGDKAEQKTAQKTDQKAAQKPEAKSGQASAARAGEKASQETAERKPAAPSVGIAPPEGKGFYVQVMATSSELEAERTVKKLALLGLPAYRMPVERKATTLWRVRVGLYKTRKEAEGVVGTIVLNGIVSKPLVGAQ